MRPFQAVPKRIVGGARAGGHGPELTVEPRLVDVLGLVGDEGDGGGVPGHARLRVRAEQHRPCATHGDGGAARVALAGGGHERIGRRQGRADALGADARLRVERGRADDDRAPLKGMRAKEERDQCGGDLVLARLPRHHHGQGNARVAGDGAQEPAQDARLVGAQGRAAGEGEERIGHGGRVARGRWKWEVGTSVALGLGDPRTTRWTGGRCRGG